MTPALQLITVIVHGISMIDGSRAALEHPYQRFKSMEACETWREVELARAETAALGGNFTIMEDRDRKQYVVVDYECRAEGFRS